MKNSDKVIRKALEIGEHKARAERAERMLEDEPCEDEDEDEATPIFARWLNTWIK